ncbi:hypothetical protein HK105_205781 [Polyrhizophydium stewartii]|uniref:Xylanolytic transcriptional activator regulatory domain-containing protein n=1 Tax=Polyrhizophydium stewartii TaxID=2732419 RepID=A0ABR4N544_9FUNG
MDASDTDPLDLEPMASDPPGGSGSGSGAVLGRNRKPFKLKWACDSCRRKVPGASHGGHLPSVRAVDVLATFDRKLKLFQRRLHTLEQQLAALSLVEGAQGAMSADTATAAATAQAQPPPQQQLDSMQQQLAGLRGELAALHGLQPVAPPQSAEAPDSAHSPASTSHRPRPSDAAHLATLGSQRPHQPLSPAPTVPLAPASDNQPASGETDAFFIRILNEFIMPIYPILDADCTFISFNSPLLKSAIRAMASRYTKSPKRGNPIYRHGEKHFRHALALVPTVFHQQASYENILALMLLTLWSGGKLPECDSDRRSAPGLTLQWSGVGKGANAFIMGYMAIAMGRALALDDETRDTVRRPQAEIQFRRRLWWIMVEIDRVGSIPHRVHSVLASASPLQTPYPDDVGWTPDKAAWSLSSTADFEATSLLAPFDEPMPPSVSKPLSATGHMMELLGIATRILAFGNREQALLLGNAPSGPNVIDAMARERLDLYAELEAWHARLPDWLRHVHDDYGTERTPAKPHVWRDTFMLVLFHAHRIELHLPSIVRMVELGLHSLALADPMLAVCIESVLVIDRIVQVFLAHNPYGHFVTSGFSMSLLSAAKVLAVLALLKPAWVDSQLFDAMFERLVTFVGNFSLLWYVAEPRLDFVRKLRRSRSPLAASMSPEYQTAGTPDTAISTESGISVLEQVSMPVQPLNIVHESDD